MDKNLPDLIEEDKTIKNKVSFVEEALYINGHLISEGTPFVEVIDGIPS